MWLKKYLENSHSFHLWKRETLLAHRWLHQWQQTLRDQTRKDLGCCTAVQRRQRTAATLGDGSDQGRFEQRRTLHIFMAETLVSDLGLALIWFEPLPPATPPRALELRTFTGRAVYRCAFQRRNYYLSLRMGYTVSQTRYTILKTKCIEIWYMLSWDMMTNTFPMKRNSYRGFHSHGGTQ